MLRNRRLAKSLSNGTNDLVRVGAEIEDLIKEMKELKAERNILNVKKLSRRYTSCKPSRDRLSREIEEAQKGNLRLAHDQTSYGATSGSANLHISH